MTGKIFDIKRFAIHDGDGIRTTVFFKGCPLRCIWCHNPEGLRAGTELQYVASRCVGCGNCVSACPVSCHHMENGIHILDRTDCVSCGKCAEACLNGALSLCGRDVTAEEVAGILLEDRSFYESSGGGITLSGGECLLQPDFCAELLCRMKREGVHTAVDTCGYVRREALDKVIPDTDIFLYDIKHMDEAEHIRLTGVSNRPILGNLRYLDDLGKEIEIRIPVIPGCNDGMLPDAAEFLSDFRHVRAVRLLAYNGLAGSKYETVGMENTMPKVAPPGREELEHMARFFRARGIRVIL